MGGELGAEFHKGASVLISALVNVTVPGMSLSESHLPKDVSQKSPDPDRGSVWDLTE